MDKVKVNNQIVLMRKYVKQAKVHAINKYVKQIKTLQMKKGNEDQLLKNKRKVSRLLEKVEILKKMKPDSVSKLALSKAKDWKSVLEEKNIPLPDQCLALLANYNAVQKEVEKFHSSESYLVPKIPSLILEWEVRGQNLNGKNKKIVDSKRKKTPVSKAASFPNNIKVSQKVEVHSKEKSMLPHLASKDSSYLKGSKETEPGEQTSLSAYTLSSNSAESDDESVYSERDTSELLDSNVSAESFNKQTRSTLDDAVTNELMKMLHHGKSKVIKQSKDVVEQDDHTETDIYEDSLDKVIKLENMDSDHKKDIQSTLITENVSNQLDLKKYLYPLKSASKKNLNSDNQSTIFLKQSVSTNSGSKKLSLKCSASDRSSVGTKSISVLDLNELGNLKEIPIQSNTSNLEKSSEQLVTRKKDAFFITSGNDSECEGDEHFRHKRNKKETDRHFNHGREYIDNFKRKFSSNKREFDKSRKQDKSKSQFHERKTFPRNEHFQKKVQHQFGNKNYLEGNECSPNYQNKHTKNQTKNFQQKKPAFRNEKSEEVLHPSWEAKRKLKESVKAGFKGKRVVFDE